MVTDTKPKRFCIDPAVQKAAYVDEDLPAAAGAASMARRHITQALTLWGFPEKTIRDAQLVVTEITANAVQHTGSPRLRLLCWRNEYVARIGVHDFSREVPVRVVSDDPLDENSRGVRLIEALSSSWGVDRAIVGKVVWAEVRAPRPRKS